MTFESLRANIGSELAVTEWMIVDQQRINLFAEATEDRQWIHIDPERARTESPYRAPVAHGFLTLSMLSRLSSEALHIDGTRMRVNYGLNRVRFPAALPAGGSIRARFRLIDVKDFAGGVDLTLAVTIELQGSAKPCCAAEWIVRYYRA